MGVNFSAFYARRGSYKNRFTFFHNNVCSLKKNFDHLQTHILDELGFLFSIIGISETRITGTNIDNFNYNIGITEKDKRQ